MVLPMGYPRPVKESEATALPAWTNCLKVLLPAVWAGTYCQSCAGSSLPGDEHVVVKNQTLLERPHCLRIQRLSNKYIPWRGLTVSKFRGCLANEHVVVKNQTLLERPHCLRIQRLSNKYIPWRGLTVSNFRGCLANTYVSSDQLLERPRGLHLGLAIQRVPPGCWPATTCA